MSILLENLVKRYGHQAVVDGVSLEIQDGELFVLLGSSGSGKSTILRMIAGLTPVDEGRILLQGKDVTNLSPQLRNTGFVFQNYALFEQMTVAQNVEFGLSVRKKPRRVRAERRDELLALVGLAGFARRYPRQLSGGQQQRVALARALAFEPAVLLLDEPLGALDVKIRAQLRRALRRIQKELKVTAILVTHDQEEAFELADRIGVIDRGRVLGVGAPADLYHRPESEFVAGFVGEANLLGVVGDGRPLRLGEVELIPPESAPGRSRRSIFAVLLRPEDLSLASRREDLSLPALGQGTIEEVLELGASQRVRLRLETQPGVFPLARDYGEAGLPLRASRPSGAAPPLTAGEKIWVGAKAWRILERAPRHFLLVHDGTGAGEEAARLGMRIAGAMGATVCLLPVASKDAEKPREEELRRAFATDDSATVVRLESGDPSDILERELSRESYDLIVLPVAATPGGADAGRARLQKHALQSAVSVLAVPAGRREIRRVLLSTAAGEAGKLDVFFGGEISRSLGAAAMLLYVEPSPEARRRARAGKAAPAQAGAGASERTDTTRSRTWVYRHLDQGVRTLLALGVRAEAKIRQGEPRGEMLSEAEEGDYDLIVLGAHLKRSYASGPERDLAREVVAQSGRPVLVVKSAP